VTDASEIGSLSSTRITRPAMVVFPSCEKAVSVVKAIAPRIFRYRMTGIRIVFEFMSSGG
jgi:hypothetical protein